MIVGRKRASRKVRGGRKTRRVGRKVSRRRRGGQQPVNFMPEFNYPIDAAGHDENWGGVDFTMQ